MAHATQNGFLFPGGLYGFSEGDDGSFVVESAQSFDAPDGFHAHQVGVKQTGIREPMNQERLGFIDTNSVDDPVLVGAETGPDGLGKIWMR